jgi:hypothetical protein
MAKRNVTITIDMTPIAAERLSRLSQLNGSYDQSEVVRRALAVYEFCLKHEADTGGRIVAEFPNGERKEVVLK